MSVLVVRGTQGKGRGVFAGEPILKGESEKVELHQEKTITLSPAKAREYAELIKKVAEEMQKKKASCG